MSDDTYTGSGPGRRPDRRPAPARADHRQGRRRADVEQRLPAALHRDRRGAADRRRERGRPRCASWSSSTARRCRRSSPRTGTPTTGRRWPRLADYAGAAVYAGERGRRRAAGRRRRAARARRRGHRRRRCRWRSSRLRGHTPGSVAVLYRDPEGIPHLFTGDSLFPGGVGKTRVARGLHLAARRRHAHGSSTCCRTTPGSTPATATTRPSAPSARTSTNGASAAGEPPPDNCHRGSRR